MKKMKHIQSYLNPCAQVLLHNFIFFTFDGTVLMSQSCPDGTCINTTVCGCIKIPLECPSDCPFVDDPDDDCKNYFVCNGDDLTPVTCADTTCFHQEACGCVLQEETTTTVSTVTPECPFVDDPNDDCSSYFLFDGTTLQPLTCTGELCYDQDECACVVKGSLTTETVPMCPKDCPFVDDPDGECSSYFICSGSTMIPVNCTGALCFDQASCACVENGGSSPTTTTSTITTTTTTTTTHLTCPSGCPFVDNPSTCESYYVCNGDNLVAVNCSQNFCFNQESCACVEKS